MLGIFSQMAIYIELIGVVNSTTCKMQKTEDNAAATLSRIHENSLLP